jgi:Tol biopolymer transport system component
VTDTLGFRIISVDGDDPAVNVDVASVIASIGIYWVSEGRWSPDGSRIAFSAFTDRDFEQLFVMKVDGSGAQAIVRGKAVWDECGPAWKPDGRTIALLSMVLHSAATVSPDGGELQAFYNPGTSCWDNSAGGDQSESGLGWSPDGDALAVTMRTPSWQQGQPFPENQKASIAIVDAGSRTRLALIDDAYDPTWTR